MSDAAPIVVQLPVSELDRRIAEAAEAGARAATEVLAPRLDAQLDLLRRLAGARGTLSTREAAVYAGVRPDTVRDWIKGGMKAARVGGSVGYQIRVEDIDDWRASR